MPGDAPSASHPTHSGRASVAGGRASASAPGRAYKAARQLRRLPLAPEPTPCALLASLTARPSPPPGPINTAARPRSSVGGRSHQASPRHWPASGDTPAPTHVPGDRLSSHC